MSLEIIVPVLMGAALLFWIGRDLSWGARLGAAAATLVLVIIVIAFERSGMMR